MWSDGPKRCLGCGYIIENLPENRRPECGRRFDADDASTYYNAAASCLSYLVVAVGAVAGACVFPLLAFRWSAPWEWLDSAGELAIAAVTATGFVLTIVVLLNRDYSPFQYA